MKDFTQQLHDDLLQELFEMDRNYDPGNLCDQRLNLIAEKIEMIKEKLKTHRFACDADEIHYFKSVLPDTLALYIYYSNRIEWDRIRMQGPAECKYRFTDRIYTQAEKFRSEFKDFYEYCRDVKTHLDRFYFLRDSPGNRDRAYSLSSIIDPCSPTLHCEMKARLLAFSRLELEMHQHVSGKKETTSEEKFSGSGLKWTDKTIYLVELGYALKEQGSFNHGNASLTDIFGSLEKAFEVDLRNTPRQFQDILGRKNGNTIYLDLLAEKLEKRIDGIENENLN